MADPIENRELQMLALIHEGKYIEIYYVELGAAVFFIFFTFFTKYFYNYLYF
jgi:hypothetical protein